MGTIDIAASTHGSRARLYSGISGTFGHTWGNQDMVTRWRRKNTDTKSKICCRVRVLRAGVLKQPTHGIVAIQNPFSAPSSIAPAVRLNYQPGSAYPEHTRSSASLP